MKRLTRDEVRAYAIAALARIDQNAADVAVARRDLPPGKDSAGRRAFVAVLEALREDPSSGWLAMARLAITNVRPGQPVPDDPPPLDAARHTKLARLNGAASHRARALEAIITGDAWTVQKGDDAEAIIEREVNAAKQAARRRVRRPR